MTAAHPRSSRGTLPQKMTSTLSNDELLRTANDALEERRRDASANGEDMYLWSDNEEGRRRRRRHR